jgi:putative Holliday junction resolvase
MKSRAWKGSCFVSTTWLLSAVNIAELGRRSLGIDYGFRRVGVAVSVGFAPRPLGCLPNAHRVAEDQRSRKKKSASQKQIAGANKFPAALIEQILDIAWREAADQIVIGLPLHSDGLESVQSRETRVFARQLAKATTLPVYLWDERFSTQQARANLEANEIHSRKRIERHIDAESACVILTEFYEYRGACAELVQSNQAELERHDRPKPETMDDATTH